MDAVRSRKPFTKCGAPDSDVCSGRSTPLPGCHRTISTQTNTRSGSRAEWATGIADFHRLAERKGLPRECYRTVEGFYDRTIGPDASYDGPLPDDVAIAYIDCDLYTSTLSVLHFLRQRLKHGMIIAFDDYFCFSATRISGERRAFLEFQATLPQFHFLEYQRYGWHGMSFVVEARDGNPSLP